MRNFFYLTFLILAFPLAVFSQENTNLDIFRRLFVETTLETETFLPKSVNFSIKPFEGEGVFKQIISETLKGKVVSFADTTKQEALLNLKVEITRCSVIYTTVSSLFQKSESVKRNFVFEVIFFGDGQSKVVQKTFSDVVRVKSISDLENDVFNFTKSKVPQTTPFFRKILDPILVGGATASAIILLFMIRK
ncbi:hypothetical protein IT568_01340 [bacterium]|nr:hypothetical protein [bacterium]